MTVKTFDGRVTSLSEMTHQHLSNWHWYNKIVLGNKEKHISEIYDHLDDRFEGEILPYRPKKTFFYEIGFLYSKGILKDNGDIIYNGDKIGEVQ